MEFVIGWLMGAATVLLIKRRSPPKRKPPRPPETDERWRRETLNFLHYDGEQQEGE